MIRPEPSKKCSPQLATYPAGLCPIHVFSILPLFITLQSCRSGFSLRPRISGDRQSQDEGRGEVEGRKAHNRSHRVGQERTKGRPSVNHSGIHADVGMGALRPERRSIRQGAQGYIETRAADE